MGIPVFDIEAVGWVHPIAIGFYNGFIYKEFIRESEQDDVLWRFLSYLKENYQGIKLYAHCASKFDNKLVLASLYQHGEIAIPEAGLIKLRWKEPKIYFEDSYLLLPMSLKKINNMFGVEEKKEWPHGENLNPWEMGERLGSFREYLKTDCLSLSHSLDKLCESLGFNFGIMPSITLSTTSVKAFDRCFYDVERIEANEEYEEFIREATYGGRNEVYKRYGEKINLYDVNSMYVSCYDTPVPIGKMRWIKGDLDRGTLAEAFVKVPKDFFIGPLPYRSRGLLFFPVGEFQGWWDVKELRYAVELGCDVTIKRQLCSDEEPILEAFGTFVTSLRQKGYKELWKLFGLSLSGKFGQSRWRDNVKYVGDIGNFKGYAPLDKDELYFQRKEYIEGRAPYIKPAVSMSIRAEARVRHLKILLEASKEGEIFYGDTDSVFTTNTLPTGGNPGELTYLGKAERGYFIRQKLYSLIQDGRMRQKSAGYSDLKLSEEDFKSLLTGKNLEQEIEELSTYKGIFKEKDLNLIERSRSLKGNMGNSRISIGFDTEPICLPVP